MILLVTKYLIPRGYNGFTVFPFVFVKNEKDRNNSILINHERIHLRQQLETGFLLFFIWYFLEFLIRLLLYRNRSKAYRNICFEKEAYANEKDLNYLKKRSFWKFYTFI
jgi:hypothetical protein